MAQKKEVKKENFIINLLFNIVIPAIILSKLSTEDKLGPLYGLLIALAFPVSYGLYDLIYRRKTNILSILGFISVLLSGVIGVMELPVEWIAVKEASIPFLIGLAILISVKTPFPLVKKLIFNPDVMDVEKIETHLQENDNVKKFDKVLLNASLLLFASFMLSAILNFVLAKIIVKSPTGTVEFNEELGKLTMLSYPIILLPTLLVTIFAIWYFFKSLKTLTGLPVEDFFFEHQQKEEVPQENDEK